MFETDAGLKVGTSSWSTRDWLGGFYPKGTPSNRFIEHYAKIYDTVEIDATFYAMPGEHQVRAWRRRTPESFTFSAKTPRVVTHDKILLDAQDDMLMFVETMAELGPRLGPLLLQFPYFNRGTFASLEPFLERLDSFLAGLPRGFRYVIEVRNRSWVGKELAAVCREHGVALAWTSLIRMPDASEWPHLTDGATADFAYIRFLGDHRGIEKITKTWDKQVLDQSAEMDAWIPIISQLRTLGVDVFTYVNNHFAGNAPETIEQFRAMWRKVKGLEDTGPTSFRPGEPEQLDLPF